jgi:hypothetical protein
MPTMPPKILIVLHEDDVAPRFDLAMGVYVAQLTPEGQVLDDKTLVMPRASAEDLCRLILTERISAVICGGIEQEYFDYLTWKQIRVIDSVIGNHEWALGRLLQDRLQPGDIQRPNPR